MYPKGTKRKEGLEEVRVKHNRIKGEDDREVHGKGENKLKLKSYSSLHREQKDNRGKPMYKIGDSSTGHMRE